MSDITTFKTRFKMWYIEHFKPDIYEKIMEDLTEKFKKIDQFIAYGNQDSIEINNERTKEQLKKHGFMIKNGQILAKVQLHKKDGNTLI